MTTLCVNPQCPQAENSDERDRCQACGSQLLLGGRFRPIQILGQGGFGRTFLAIDEAADSSSQRCVVKQIIRSPNTSPQSRFQEAFAEAERLSHLGQHPQIPSLIAILESSRDICLVQTFVSGKNLEQSLTAEGPFDEKQVRSLLQALLPALKFIHEQGVIHRDIKPENILLPDNESLPVLVDFGAARDIPTAAERQKTGTVIGSAGYAAPEQALGKAVAASDLYSLGMVCIRLLTGEHPFTLYSVAEDCWIWETFLINPVSPALSRILTKLIARPLRSRYGSADAVLTDLDPAGILSVRSPSPTVIIPKMPRYQCTQIWQTPGRVANALALSPDGRAIATANSDNSVQLWDSQTGEILQTFAQRLGLGNAHTDAVTALSFHPDGGHLFSGSRDGTVKLWNLQTYRLEHTFNQPGWQVTAMALTPKGDLLATGDIEGKISLWDRLQCKRLVDLVRHTQAITDLKMGANGCRLISASEDGTLRLWSLPEGRLLHTWTTDAALRAIELSHTSSEILTGNLSGRVTLWSLTDFEQQRTLRRYQDAISALALSQDEQTLAVGGEDATIQLWDWAGTLAQSFSTLRHDWSVRDIVFSHDSQTLMSSAADETIRCWKAVSP